MTRFAVTPQHLPYTATKVTANNIVELAQKYDCELYVTDTIVGIDWDADTLVRPGHWIVTDAAGTPIDACDTQELRDNYIIGEEK